MDCMFKILYYAVHCTVGWVENQCVTLHNVHHHNNNCILANIMWEHRYKWKTTRKIATQHKPPIPLY